MKKVIISLMLIVLIVGMTGCNSSQISEDTYAEKAKVIFVSEMEQGEGEYVEMVPPLKYCPVITKAKN